MIKQLSTGLYVGNGDDLVDWPDDEGFAALHCAKDPWHRQMVGYDTRSAPEGPERLVARRGNRMALNMVDAPSAEFFDEEMVQAGLDFISERIVAGDRVLVHCNMGVSRSPSMALLWMHRNDQEWAAMSFDEATEALRHRGVEYWPGNGIAGFLKAHWDD